MFNKFQVAFSELRSACVADFFIFLVIGNRLCKHPGVLSRDPPFIIRLIIILTRRQKNTYRDEASSTLFQTVTSKTRKVIVRSASAKLVFRRRLDHICQLQINLTIAALAVTARMLLVAV